MRLYCACVVHKLFNLYTCTYARCCVNEQWPLSTGLCPPLAFQWSPAYGCCVLPMYIILHQHKSTISGRSGTTVRKHVHFVCVCFACVLFMDHFCSDTSIFLVPVHVQVLVCPNSFIIMLGKFNTLVPTCSECAINGKSGHSLAVFV